MEEERGIGQQPSLDEQRIRVKQWLLFRGERMHQLCQKDQQLDLANRSNFLLGQECWRCILARRTKSHLRPKQHHEQLEQLGGQVFPILVRKQGYPSSRGKKLLPCLPILFQLEQPTVG